MLVDSRLEKYFININSTSAFRNFTDALYDFIIKAIYEGYQQIIFICIGTDRCTGDSLGPLIGHKIINTNKKNIYIYGTLENPIHAKNLDNTMEGIYAKYENPFIIAVDACLGKLEHVGFISIGQGPIKPGAALKKDLSPVGDIHVTGIVNLGGFMDFLVLQNTRLFLVMKMADLIASGIKHVLWKIEKSTDLFSFC